MLTNIQLMDYNQYLNTASHEEIISIKELWGQGKLLEEGQALVKNIKKKLNILVITSTMCKDSATIVPFLMKLAVLNKNINVKFLLKKDNEELLEKLSGELKVPAIMVLDSEKLIERKFIEFPRELKDILIANSKEKTQEIIDDMRAGKYNNLIQEDLIRFLTGENYNYISFQRLDK